MPDRNAEIEIAINAKNNTGDVFKQLMSGVKGLAGAFGIAFSLNAAKEAFEYLVKSGEKADRTTTMLASSLSTARGGSQAMLESMVNLSTQMSKVSGYSEEEIQSAFKNLTDITKDANAAFKAINPTMEMARARNIDLSTAANLVGRAYSQGTVVLRRYGVETSKNLKETEALTAIHDKFKYALEDYGNSAEGIRAKDEAGFKNLSDTLGEKLLPLTNWWHKSLAVAWDFLNKIATKIDFTPLVKSFEDAGVHISVGVAALGAQVRLFLTALTHPFDKKAMVQAVSDYHADIERITKSAKERLEKIEKQHLTHQAQVHKNAAAQDAQIDLEKMSKELDTYKKGTSQLTPLMHSKYKTMFEIGKAASIAQTIIEAQHSAMEAYSAFAGIPVVGPELGIAAAIAALAYGGERVAEISGQNFNPSGAAHGLFNDSSESMISTFKPTEIVIPQRFSEGIQQGKYALTGNGSGGGGGDVHYHAHFNGPVMGNARDIMKTHLLPELRSFAIKERGGKLVKSDGSPNF